MDPRTDSRPNLLVLDAYNLLYRAYHALPPMRTPDGRPANALYGFCRMVIALIDQVRPAYVAVAVDEHAEGPTFREELCPEYKAQRPPMPEDMVAQIPVLPDVCRALGVRTVGVPGFEADDIMGTLSLAGHERGWRTYLATGDKDAYQLVSEDTFVCTADKGLSTARVIGAEEVREALGVGPARVVEWKSLTGDASDNVRGAEGIGPKKATQLLEQFDSLADMLGRTDEIRNPRMRSAVEQAADVLRRNLELLRIRTDVPLDVEPTDLAYQGPDPEAAREVLTALGFRSILERLAPAEEAPVVDGPRAGVRVLRAADSAALEELAAAAAAAGAIAVLPRMAGARLLDLAIATSGDDAVAVVLETAGGGGLLDLLEDPELVLPEPLTAILRDPAIEMICFDAKQLIRALEPAGVTPLGITEDLGLAAYVCLHGEGGGDASRLATSVLGESIAAPDRPEATAALAARLFAVAEKLTAMLREQGLEWLYRTVELPTAFVLARMESRGVAIDRERLRELGGRLKAAIAEAEERVYALAGTRFLIGSPQQLQVVLYETLGLARGKKTKTGYSTDATTLEALADEHEVIAPILEWRQLTKLQSTYVDALLHLADPKTDRVHTQYNQRVAITGRLSSSDPNLQNIPIRSEWGREVRKCFVAPADGWALLSCDYSQVELRILAHFSRDAMLLVAFQEGLDVHAHTASLLFDVPIGEVTREQRGAAKTVNFGIVYGMGSQKLAQDLAMSRQAAKDFIDNYFAHYSGVREYLEAAKQQAHEDGCVLTLTGRRRNLPDIHSSRPQLRSAAERMAVNTPIQGSAADLMKCAMLRVEETYGADPTARLLLQVHDELVLEVREERLAEVAARVRELMAEPPAFLEASGGLAVPLVVDAKVGANWGQMTAYP